jgi:DNA-binding NarL/FixJ family response regulator
MGPEIPILIASPRVLDCELYAQALRQHPGFEIVGRVFDVDSAVHAVECSPISVALISANLQDGPLSGLTALQRINQMNSDVKPVVLFEPGETNLVLTAFRNGARGVFCPAEDGFEQLCRCVEQVHAGQIWAKSVQFQEMLTSFPRRASLQIVNSDGALLLTRREQDVVGLVEEGLTNRQIAQELKLSEHTVRNNLFRIFDKLGISTRVELTLYAINNRASRSPVEDDALERVVAFGPSGARPSLRRETAS